MRRSLGALLGKQNDVGVAENGAVGLAMLTEGPDAWDVVLCDLMMPVMNGRQMYERLLESSPAEAARIVFMTGGATTPETSAFLAALPNVLLTKPFDLDELRALIAQRVASRT
jgi:CheY-like chemotaxis protein